MYSKFISDFGSKHSELPKAPDLELGLAIKEIRLRMGMTQDELAQNARIKQTALKTLENGYARFTKFSNLEAIARVLRTTPQEILLEAREWFPANFFVVKESEAPLSGRRKKKTRIETWVKQKPLTYEGFTINMATPPMVSPAHFFFFLIEIKGGANIKNLKLPHVGQIAGFVQRGSLHINYDENKELDVFGNQGFTLRGDKVHSFHNVDPDNTLRFFLVGSSHRPGSPHPIQQIKVSANSFSVANIIKHIRALYSPSKERPISFSQLAQLTELDEKSLYHLEKSTGSDQVVYWDKIEKMSQALAMPFSELLALGYNRSDGYLQLATAHDRALIDYRHYIGIQIKSILFPSPTNVFHMAEVYIEAKKGIKRASWKRKDNAMIAVYVEDGDIRIEVGKNRKTRLKEGESLYFDGSLEYIFTNPGLKPCKILMASYPAIIF